MAKSEQSEKFDAGELLTTLASRGETPELGPDNALPAEMEPRSMEVRSRALAAEKMLQNPESLPPEEVFAYSAIVEHGKAQEVMDMMNNTVRAAQRGREGVLREEIYGTDLLDIKNLEGSIMEVENSFSENDRIGGLAEAEEQSQDENLVGGIAELAGYEAPIAQKANVEVEEKHFDPISLLEIGSMPVDEFFKLDRDEVYRRLHRLQSLPVDNPSRTKALNILKLIEEGEEKYRGESPDAEIVSF